MNDKYERPDELKFYNNDCKRDLRGSNSAYVREASVETQKQINRPASIVMVFKWDKCSRME